MFQASCPGGTPRELVTWERGRTGSNCTVLEAAFRDSEEEEKRVSDSAGM